MNFTIALRRSVYIDSRVYYDIFAHRPASLAVLPRTTVLKVYQLTTTTTVLPLSNNPDSQRIVGSRGGGSVYHRHPRLRDDGSDVLVHPQTIDAKCWDRAMRYATPSASKAR